MLKEERKVRSAINRLLKLTGVDDIQKCKLQGLLNQGLYEMRVAIYEDAAKIADKNCIEYEHLEPLSMERSWHRCSTAAAIRRGR